MVAFRYTSPDSIPSLLHKKWNKRDNHTTIQTIARNNNFPQNLLKKTQLENTTQWNETRSKNKNDNNITLTTIRYYTSEIRKINLFKHTTIKIAFKNTNTLLKPQTNNNIQEYDESGIYKLTRNTCHKSYIGQSNHSLKQRFQKRNRYVRHNDPQSAYAGHTVTILLTRRFVTLIQNGKERTHAPPTHTHTHSKPNSTTCFLS
jgi:hypothetical protein